MIDTERDALVAHIHARAEFDSDYCEHGKYHGGSMDGEPYAMCERKADALLLSSWLTEHDAAKDAEIAELRSERSDYQQKWHQANRRITELVAEDAEIARLTSERDRAREWEAANRRELLAAESQNRGIRAERDVWMRAALDARRDLAVVTAERDTAQGNYEAWRADCIDVSNQLRDLRAVQGGEGE